MPTPVIFTPHQRRPTESTIWALLFGAGWKFAGGKKKWRIHPTRLFSRFFPPSNIVLVFFGRRRPTKGARAFSLGPGERLPAPPVTADGAWWNLEIAAAVRPLAPPKGQGPSPPPWVAVMAANNEIWHACKPLPRCRSWLSMPARPNGCLSGRMRCLAGGQDRATGFFHWRLHGPVVPAQDLRGRRASGPPFAGARRMVARRKLLLRRQLWAAAQQKKACRRLLSKKKNLFPASCRLRAAAAYSWGLCEPSAAPASGHLPRIHLKAGPGGNRRGPPKPVIFGPAHKILTGTKTRLFAATFRLRFRHFPGPEPLETKALNFGPGSGTA